MPSRTNRPASTKRRGILAGGNWIIDQVKLIDVFPQRESLANISRQSQGTGGSPYNVLVNLAKLGAPFPLHAAGLVGADPLGRAILEDCKRHRIKSAHLKASPKADTSYTDVMTEQRDGKRTFFHMRGANALWTGKDLDFRRIPAAIFHLGYLLLLDGLDAPDAKFGTRAARLLAQAQAAGLKTSIDVVSEDSDRFASIVVPALRHTHYCILNELEAGNTTGFKIRAADASLDTAALRLAAARLLELGAGELVVIHFPEGGFALTRSGEEVLQPSLNLPPGFIAGSAGAGDAFCAGVLYGLHEGWPLTQSLRTAVCAAAASLADPTCTGGMKPLKACLALGKKHGCRAPFG